MEWNSLMDYGLKRLWETGISKEQIIACFENCKLKDRVIESLSYLHGKGHRIFILSDSNTVYIDTIMNSCKCSHMIEKIITNPALFTEDGRLTLSPYQERDKPHGCNLCPPNLCKGQTLQKLIRELELEEFKKIYIGDGKGDYCPCKDFKDGDYILARSKYPLLKKLNELKDFKPMIIPWEDGSQFLDIFTKIL